MEILEGFELVLLMHVVFGHDLLELGARHVHTTPSAIQVNDDLKKFYSTNDYFNKYSKGNLFQLVLHSVENCKNFLTHNF